MLYFYFYFRYFFKLLFYFVTSYFYQKVQKYFCVCLVQQGVFVPNCTRMTDDHCSSVAVASAFEVINCRYVKVVFIFTPFLL